MQEAFKLINGDMLQELDKLEECSIDCIITDPPYELGFMGKSWDSAGISFQKSTWEKCIRVLKPGGYLISFGGSIGHHRITCAIEDAGFEIRDCIMWLFGSGMPKGINIGLAIDKKSGVESKVIGEYGTTPDFNDVGKKQEGISGINKRSFGQVSDAKRIPYYILKAQNDWDGWNSQLKPAYEVIIIARKPFEGSLVDNVLKNGVGGLNIDECRVPISSEDIAMINAKSSKNPTDNYMHSETRKYGVYNLDFASPANETGRFPSNVILTYDDTDYDEVCGGMPNCGSGNGGTPYNYAGREYNNKDTSMFNGDKPIAPSNYNDSGSASRYFYCAKASKRDRNEGLSNKINDHPCVKPQSLLQYLIRLVAPKGATILDPFMGSGSTGKAVAYENFDRNANYKFIGIELDKEYTEIAKARIEYVIKNPIPIDTKPIVKSKTDNSKKVHKLF